MSVEPNILGHATSRRTLLAAGAGAIGTVAAGGFKLANDADATTVGLYNKLYNIDLSTTGGLAVAVTDARSGRSWQYNSPFRNECASIVKVLILATVCWRAQQQRRGLTTWEKSTASNMIRYSDNNSATALWRTVGGAPAVQAMANRLGMYQTTTSTAWGLTRTSAWDQMLLMNEISWRGRLLTSAMRSYILGLMGSVTSSQRWGVGSYGIAQVKNGWLPYNGQWRVNSIGHVTGGGRNYTLAIIQRTPTMYIGTSVANRVALTMYNHLATPL